MGEWDDSPLRDLIGLGILDLLVHLDRLEHTLMSVFDDLAAVVQQIATEVAALEQPPQSVVDAVTSLQQSASQLAAVVASDTTPSDSTQPAAPSA